MCHIRCMETSLGMGVRYLIAGVFSLWGTYRVRRKYLKLSIWVILNQQFTLFAVIVVVRKNSVIRDLLSIEVVSKAGITDRELLISSHLSSHIFPLCCWWKIKISCFVHWKSINLFSFEFPGCLFVLNPLKEAKVEEPYSSGMFVFETVHNVWIDALIY